MFLSAYCSRILLRMGLSEKEDRKSLATSTVVQINVVGEGCREQTRCYRGEYVSCQNVVNDGRRGLPHKEEFGMTPKVFV